MVMGSSAAPKCSTQADLRLTPATGADVMGKIFI